METKLIINLITYNSVRYLRALFKSLQQQTFKNWQLNILDNNSSDNTIVVIKSELNKLNIKYNLIISKQNLGFASGHNKLFSKIKSRYFLILNDDTVLGKDCLEKMTDFLNYHTNVASVSPRLMRLDNKNIVDSLGLKLMPNRRVIDSYSGENYYSIFKNFKHSNLKVFGVSGTCAMFRKKAVDTVCYTSDELFDSSYFMYKEDVDLAYRLIQSGFINQVLLSIVCYHDRSGAGIKNLSDIATIKNKAKQSKIVKYYSYKNHLATLYKNEYWQNLVLDWPGIKWYELKKFIYFLLFDRSVLRGWRDLWKDIKNLKEKRLKIKKLRKITWKEFRQYVRY